MVSTSGHVLSTSLALCFGMQVLLNYTHAVKFPNDIDGQPEVECGDGAVRISVKTTNGVASKLYAKGHYTESQCNFEKSNSGHFSIGTCGMNRQRQLEPRGISYSLVVVVQLHPMFVTKVDRAYSVKCFYMEAEKPVTSFLDVSMLLSTEAVTAGAPMPICNYELHSDSPNGPSVRYARVGDRVWHTWTCPSPTYGILVHSCMVTDGQGNDFRVIDERGCGLDEYVFRTPEYSADLTRVQQETHVFKFADKTAVTFNCQIKLCQKAENGCEGISPPTCVVPGSPVGQSEGILSEVSTGTESSTTTSTGPASASTGPATATTGPGTATSTSVTPVTKSNITSVFNIEPTPSTIPSTSPAPQVVSINSLSTTGQFPTPSSFSDPEILDSNATFLNEPILNETSLNERILNETILNERINDTNANEENGSSVVIGLENASFSAEIDVFSPPIDRTITDSISTYFNQNSANGSSVASLASITMENVTLPLNWTHFTLNEAKNWTEPRNISTGDDEIETNSSSFSIPSIETGTSSIHNSSLTTAGFISFSKNASGNLSSFGEASDTVKQIPEIGWEWGDDNESLTFYWDNQENETANWTRTTTEEPLALANATILILASGDRRVLNPLVKRTVDAVHNLVRRENRLHEHEVSGQLEDIETDVSQMMWVLEPEEALRGSHYGKIDNGKDAYDNEFESLNNPNGNQEDGNAEMKYPTGRVCLSKRTMVAMILPFVVILLIAMTAFFFCIRRLRAKSTPVHIRQSFPLNYPLKISH